MNKAHIITLFGTDINLMSVAIILALVGLLYMFWKIQRDDKLDFTDMITANGRTVSLTKLLQLIGGVTGTWVVIKLALAGTITGEIFMIYLAYVASIEGFSKFIQARYKYEEGSVRDYRSNNRYGGGGYGGGYQPPAPRPRREPVGEIGLETEDEAAPPRDQNYK